MTAILEPLCSPDLRSSFVGGVAVQEGSTRKTEVFGGQDSYAAARCRDILDYYAEDSSNPDHEKARWVVDQLTRDEQEVAAQCSYAYWFLSKSAQQHPSIPNTKITDSARFAAALREAIRHMGCAEDINEILRLFRATLEFHVRHKTRLYRTCMNTPAMTKTTIASEADSGDRLLIQQRRERIVDEMKNYQTNVIRGHDKEDRAIFFAFPRSSAGASEEAFVDAITYSLERALASSEFQSIGRQDEIFCILDTMGGSCPPVKTLKAALGVLQHFYPGRLKNCAILHPHYLLNGIFKVMKPFLHPVTASKFMLVSAKQLKSNRDNDCPISKLIDESQAMPVLMPGRGNLTSEVDVDRFLYRVPFYRLYDAKEPEPKVDRPIPATILERRSLAGDCSVLTLRTESSSSIDSEPSNTSTPEQQPRRTTDEGRRSVTGRFGKRASRLRQRMSSRRSVAVSVRSLATGELAILHSPLSDSLPYSPESRSEVLSVKVHRRHNRPLSPNGWSNNQHDAVYQQ